MRKRIIVNIFLTIFISFLLLSSVGCGKSASTAASTASNSTASTVSAVADESKFDVVRVPSPSSPTSVDSITIAEELGYFKAEKIKIERVGVIPFEQVVPSLIAGKLDFAGGHINRGVAAIAAGAKIRAVAANSQTTQEKPHMTFIVLENSPIKTVNDILGKKVAIMAYGGCNEYTPYEYLKKNGISDPKGKFTIVITPMGKEEEALRKGSVDIAGVHDDPANLKARGGLRILFTDYDIWGETGGQAPYYASEKFLSDKPDIAKRFVKVIGETNNWINANQQKSIEICAKSFKVDPAIVRVAYLVPDAIIKEDTVKIWVDVLKGYNDLKRDVTLSEVYTNDFNPYFKK